MQKYSIHPSSYCDDPVFIGDGTQIWHFCHIMKDARIGGQCKIGQNVVIGPGVRIGSRVKIQNNVSVYPGVTLEDDVFCGPSMVFTNIINPRSAINRNSPEFYRPTLVKKGATIGANATIVCGVTIGKNAFIGAGAVVTRDVADYALVYGNPARQNGWICSCGEKISFNRKKQAPCNACAKQYTLQKNICKEVI
jgi:UDP-2-acetamido-3-amino-2,3-dideoxy-glucuronate N-acetyltransferase